jgi:phospholipid/cholesterol/gamma-HCH transport system permease protein
VWVANPGCDLVQVPIGIREITLGVCSLMDRLQTVKLWAIIEETGHLAHFAARAVGALPAAILKPGESLRQFHRVLIGSLPISLLAGVAIGLVLWMHVRNVITRSSIAGPTAVQYLPTALALAVVLEFAPIGAGLIIAGRVGASLGAEIGAMRITEQIEAIEVLGVSAMRQLVGPRVLACMVALPILTIFMAVLALSSAYVAEMAAGTLSSIQYEENTWKGLQLEDAVPAVAKTIVFGFVVGVSGCFFGMRAAGGTEGVGIAATRGVELATFLVLLANVLLVKLIQVLIL